MGASASSAETGNKKFLAVLIMSPLIDKTLSGLRDSLLVKTRGKAAERNRAVTLTETMERVIDGTDGRIRLVGGYKKKLLSVIQTSLEYTDSLIDTIPKAIEINHTTYVTNPYVNAFFYNIKDLQGVFSHSSELRDFLEDFENQTLTQSCALLCMQMTEKTVLGMELSGDMLKKDVRQVAVNFSDHRIYSPAPTEPSVREGLKQCLFEGLVTNALGRIMELRLSNRRLQHERQMLRAQLRRAESGKENPALSEQERRQEIEAIRREIIRTEDDLNRIHSATPQVSLDQVIEVFSHPESFVHLNRRSIKLNKMGIKIRKDSAQPANNLNLTEAIIGREKPRVITLAKFPRDELLPQKHPLRDHDSTAYLV